MELGNLLVNNGESALKVPSPTHVELASEKERFYFFPPHVHETTPNDGLEGTDGYALNQWLALCSRKDSL